MTEDESVTALIFFYLIIIIIFDKILGTKIIKTINIDNWIITIISLPMFGSFVYFKYKTPFQQISPGSQNVLQKWAR